MINSHKSQAPAPSFQGTLHPSLSLSLSLSLSVPGFANMAQSKKFRGVRQRHWGSWVAEIRHPLLYSQQTLAIYLLTTCI